MYSAKVMPILRLTALNYLRRPLQSRLEIFAFVSVVMQLFFGLTRFSKGMDVLNPLQLMGPMFLASYVCHQWKQGLAYPQARIIPGFRKIQTIVMVAIMILYTAICVSVFWPRNDAATGLMMLALFVGLIDCLLAMVMVPRNAWLVLPPWVALWIWMSSSHGQERIASFMLSNHGLTPLALSIFGLIAAVYLIRGSLLQTEESAGFDRELVARTMGNRTGTTAPQKIDGALGRFLLAPSDRQLDALARRRGGWSYIRRWQVGVIGFRQAILLSIISLAFALVLGLLNQNGKQLFVGTLFVASFGLPVIFTSASWGWRASRVAADLVRPVARRAYFREMFLAAALSFAELWITLTLVMIAGYYVAIPDVMSELLLAIGFSLGFNLLFFGASAWLSRYGESIPLLFVVSMVVVIPVVVTVVTIVRPQPPAMLLPCLFLGFALTGIILTFDAYRRWLRTEVALLGQSGRSWRGSSAEMKPDLAR